MLPTAYQEKGNAMFIAITIEDFDTFRENNEGKDYGSFTTDTQYPIFTGMTVEETRSHIENYYRIELGIEECDTLPKYAICKIDTVAYVTGTYKLTTECHSLSAD